MESTDEKKNNNNKELKQTKVKLKVFGIQMTKCVICFLIKVMHIDDSATDAWAHTHADQRDYRNEN